MTTLDQAISGLVGGAASAIVILAALRSLGTEALKRVFDAALARFNHQLKLDELRHGLALKTASEFKAQQLNEFYWPIYVRLQKDNAVWDKILYKRKADENLRKIGLIIEENVILPNHREVVKIIEDKIHLAQADHDFQHALMGYVRHVSVYGAIRASGIQDRDPISFEEPWPKDLFGLVEERTSRLQAEYDALIASTRLNVSD